MPQLKLGPTDVVDDAHFKVEITLERTLKGKYSSDDLATMTVRIPVGSEYADSAGAAVVVKALGHLRDGFEAVYGEIAPVRPVVAAADEQETMTVPGGSLDDLPFDQGASDPEPTLGASGSRDSAAPSPA